VLIIQLKTVTVTLAFQNTEYIHIVLLERGCGSTASTAPSSNNMPPLPLSYWKVWTAKVVQGPVRRFKNTLNLNKSVAESAGSSGFELSLMS
jgi:hypothetical protein